MDSIREMWFREERFQRYPRVAEAALRLAAAGVVTEAVWAAAWNEVYGNDGGSGAVVVELPVRPSAPTSVLVVAA